MVEQSVIILAIETSCDDTSIAVLKDGEILSNIIYGQKVHEKYGGVIPEEASRQHIQNILPVLHESLTTANINLNEINAIAFTQSPGLIGSLIVGAVFAKSLSQTLNIPLIAVNHTEAHVLSNLIQTPKPQFPFLCLTVSGGHTQIVLCKDAYSQEIIGKTIDDAAGEAFDKAAKMLGLSYPGGPVIDKLAKLGNAKKFEFAKPQISGYDYSFSGIKTSILYFLQKNKLQNVNFIKENLNDLAASIQYTIVTVLIKKLTKAAKDLNINTVCIAGGVSANSELRNSLKNAGENYNWKTFIPNFEYCTDNAAMIAITAYYKYLKKDFVDMAIIPSARV